MSDVRNKDNVDSLTIPGSVSTSTTTSTSSSISASPMTISPSSTTATSVDGDASAFEKLRLDDVEKPSSPATKDENPEENKGAHESYQSPFSGPPPVKRPYVADEALDDVAGIQYALELFLASKMIESEEYCVKSDPDMERLYFATGYGLIQCVKGLMSYEDPDLLAAISHTKHGNAIASAHRTKGAGGVVGGVGRLFGYVVPSLSPTAHIEAMTAVERHAELVYAESLFEKALLGIVYSGDWLAFIKEALNMRTTISIYRRLYEFIEAADEKYRLSLPVASPTPSSPLSPAVPPSTPTEDPSIDPHFRSGVYLGIGLSNIILSLMPSRILSIVELFGYHGDRKFGLQTLMRAGGWTKGVSEPGVNTANEGARRAICDMALLMFHLVLSSFTFECVDVGIAQTILEWNLKRYPNGVFFLFGAGRLALVRSQPAEAVRYYTLAMKSQTQYRNLHHVSFWEMAIAKLALWDVSGALECWRELAKDATWSKSIYTYGTAVCLLQLSMANGDDDKKKEAIGLMAKVPELRQRIAGKSIPLEKFVARKARKFQSQNYRLLLPALELAYVFLGIAHAPREVVKEKMLVEVRKIVESLEAEFAFGGGDEKEPSSSPSSPVSPSTPSTPTAMKSPILAQASKLAMKFGASDKQTEEKERKKKKKLSKYEGGEAEFWDDYCLVKFLEGVCLRYVAYPDPDASLSPSSLSSIPEDRASASLASIRAFETVFKYGEKISLDHHIVYHAHYELGRVMACKGDEDEARRHFELVLSGKTLTTRKGKYSMENALHVRTHAALETLDSQHKRL